jgi:signal transduction histidine kinase
MELKRRNLLVYGLLAGFWVLVVAWQVEEHYRVAHAAETYLFQRSQQIVNMLGACIRGLRFRGAVFPERLEPVLHELVNPRTNELVHAGELISVALLNAAGDQLVSAGRPIDLQQKDLREEGVHWGLQSVTMVYPLEGISVTPQGVTNASPTVVPPPFRELTNSLPQVFRNRPFPHHEPRSEETNMPGRIEERTNRDAAAGDGPHADSERPPPPPEHEIRPPRRPFWARGLDEKEYEAWIQTRELHGLVLSMSTESLEAIRHHDFWLRCIIASFAGISVLGVGLAWGNLAKSSELQIRLVRASELNTHLKEMNLAAAGLAHETRNPLNIVRGLAQMISRQPESPSEIRDKSRRIIDETDKVTAQLNEFINYSRPRELRRSALSLQAVLSEVVRALAFDIEEKDIRVETKGETLSVEADEQQLRQVLFNLLLNAVQAVDRGGEIQVLTRRLNASEGSIEIRDNGPGVPEHRRAEIFKPYFTTQQQGTGLGLAIVQQIVLAHGWEIACLANQPKGAIFRITHLQLAGRH